ncbi:MULTISPECIES: NAD(P)-dependent oxidoreductase [unclassified Fusibacter]|uniref:NAD(P)-dependent oxidoreductase n=1 Tax=unclassified Fusibacter TaxID=2624464 RepID=UPI0013E9048C|nr:MULTISPECIES: NAD(P)-dependent oxidoreductase [unclassified Fusibacter]MCK8060231.1 hypothetical protein [Fusibacter sp. A2]NPE22370.1 hypothetical protein [Fusibacter sp. A1]
MYYAATIYDKVYKYITTNKEREFNKANIEFRLADKDLGVHSKVQALITGEFNKAMLEVFPNVRAVIVPYTGLNGLDTAPMQSKGIMIFNSTAHSHFVAERALALTLAVLGKLVFYNNNLMKGDWSKRTEPDRVSWTSLSNKRVAIYGYGIIGKEIHRLMKPFGIEVGVLDYRNRRPHDVHVFKRLEELAVWSDVFVIAVPLTDETNGRIDETMFAALKKKVLINIGRGQIIDEDALYESLKSGDLKGFGSDVWFQYPSKDRKIVMPSKHPIESFDNVVMTPHCAGFEDHSLELRYSDVADQLIRIAGGDFRGRKL